MIAIIQYQAGNIASVTHALDSLGYTSMVTDDISCLQSADKVIFPGVGEARTAMQHLRKKGLDQIIPQLKQPVLGICLGMQLLCAYSEEGNTKGLGVFQTQVKKFPAAGLVPHIGWNDVYSSKHTLFKSIPSPSDFYFVHSYYAEIDIHTIAQTEYILPFSAALQHHNFYATQFHPEKSASIGLQLLQNFLSL